MLENTTNMSVCIVFKVQYVVRLGGIAQHPKAPEAQF